MDDEDIDFGGVDIDELERQIAAMDGDDVDLGPGSKKGKSKAKGKASPGSMDEEEIDVDKLLAEMSDGEPLDDSDPELQEMYGIKKVEKPKVAPPAKSQQKPAPAPVQKSQPQESRPTKTSVIPDTTVGQDSNGVSEDVLIEEENIYHAKEDIFSITCMNHEIENYINPIIDGKLVGTDYQDVLEMQKDEWQMYIDNVVGRIQSGKMDMKKYLEFVELGNKSQKSLLGKAQSKKASKTTIDRIKKRLELLESELADLYQQLGEQPKAEDSLTEETKAPPPAPKYLVPEDKLELLSKAVNQYIFFFMYCQENAIPLNPALMSKVKDVKTLFKNPFEITKDQYKAAMESLPPITVETLLGMSPGERNAKLEVMLKEAEESFEKMKEFGCTKEEAKDTADVIKYLRKIKDEVTIRLPAITETELTKSVVAKVNQAVPDDCIRLTLIKLSGAADHRTVFMKYRFDYGNTHKEGETPYVTSIHPA